ncbi:15-cis-phytoene synthase [Jannaschia ovalis]|uniref:Phytoene/squalene synthase family protein n=1 Tax=Jannaschia ovalis TaxID=3038773 RepID=A0ABY8LG13_9RHOB|nr:phytoene/squalene synthase family protein [Jannaschia sp. GRR-S6-38]WGH80239.1 phytoene/squalene synthase family protein [Jannaschia sp. GRR-S6-38]
MTDLAAETAAESVADMAHCREAIRTGSLSFHAASRLLPGRVRDPALALYAFCRLADDAVDETADKAPAVLALRDRLEAAFAGRPRNAPADRAFTRVIETFDMPRALPEALLEGLAWDATDRRYDTLSELRAYSARVASAVGAMMCVLMRVRDADALARACDLGVAMQLTNIARDVGEDARAGRLYLPTDWMAGVGLDPQAFLAAPEPDARTAALTRRLLAEARRLYHRSEAGVAALPVAVRPGILAARHIYDGIGGAVARNGHDSISRRARTGRARKLGWLVQAGLHAATVTLLPRSAVLHAPPLDETAFLVRAAADPRHASQGWGDELAAVFAQLAATDRLRAGPLDGSGARPS